MKKKYFAALLLFVFIVIIILFSFKKEIKYNKYATIEIEEKEYNFGTIQQNSKVKFKFIIKNISNNPFYILKVTTSEKTNFLDTKIKKIIDTNNSTFIAGEINANNIGKYYNSINVESNSKVKIKLVIRGYVVAPKRPYFESHN